MANTNILSPATGKPIVTPTQDMVLGIYYLTIDKPNSNDPKEYKGAGMFFSSEEEAITAFHTKKVDMFAKVKLRTSHD